MNTKCFGLLAFAAVSGVAHASYVVQTVDLGEVCPAYQRGEYSQAQVGGLQKQGIDLSVSCQPFEAKIGAERLAVNMMAQFYRVKESEVNVVRSFRGQQEGTVTASDQAGHVCSFAMQEAPKSIDVPYGWLIANTFCEVSAQ